MGMALLYTALLSSWLQSPGGIPGGFTCKVSDISVAKTVNISRIIPRGRIVHTATQHPFVFQTPFLSPLFSSRLEGIQENKKFTKHCDPWWTPIVKPPKF
jgi:hypothetical protein